MSYILTRSELLQRAAGKIGNQYGTELEREALYLDAVDGQLETLREEENLGATIAATLPKAQVPLIQRLSQMTE